LLIKCEIKYVLVTHVSFVIVKFNVVMNVGVIPLRLYNRLLLVDVALIFCVMFRYYNVRVELVPLYIP